MALQTAVITTSLGLAIAMVEGTVAVAVQIPDLAKCNE